MNSQLTLKWAFWAVFVMGNLLFMAVLKGFNNLPEVQLFWGYCIFIVYGFGSGGLVWVKANNDNGELLYRDLSKILVVFWYFINCFFIYTLYDPKHTWLINFIDKYFRHN